LTTLDESSDTIIAKDVISNLYIILDVFEVKQDGNDTSSEARKLRNYLSSATKENVTNIESFIMKNSPKMTRTIKKEIVDFLTNPTNLPASSPGAITNAEENAVYRDLHFAQNMMRNIVEVIPNMIINQVNTTRITVPMHWGLSYQHETDIKTFIQKYYDGLTRFYDDKSVAVIMKAYYLKYRMLVKLINQLVYLASMPGFDNANVLDDITVKLLIDYFLSVAFEGFVKLSNEQTLTEMKTSSNIDQTGAHRTHLSNDNGDIDIIAIMRGERQQLQGKIADFMNILINMMKDERSMINYSYDSVNERVHRIKDREKDLIVKYMENMTDEEREIENNLKNAKLGRWSKGLNKGVFAYVAENYDEERNAMETQMALERKAGRLHQVTEMNREIFMDDVAEADRVAAEIEADEYDMSYIGEDNDDGFDADD
jgi:hypothetical protein